ncbi:MAG: response regulator [Bacteroidia bacterium]
MKILIVEDEMLIAEDISEILEEMGHEPIGIADNFNEALHMAKANKPDLALLDIRIKGDKDGVEVGKALYSDLGIRSVFLTSHSDKTIVKRAIAANPLSYLIKPVKEDELFVAMQVAQKQIVSVRGEKDFFIKLNGLKQKVKLNDVSHLESEGNYTNVYIKGEKFVTSKVLKNWLDESEMIDFVRVHRSFAVNVNLVTEIRSKSLLVTNTEVPIGRAYKESIEKLI